MEQRVAISIWNDRSRPHIVWIEPWGEDYTILSGEKFIISTVGSDADTGPWFALVETGGNTQVYVERGSYPQVELDGVQLECGHNRQAAVAAGIWNE
ncbi:MAG: hypothetical protein H6822_24815 [Planctomycetaceae bacterium]|nr:hypothetical protein [Planctomycetaceae bacterium]